MRLIELKVDPFTQFWLALFFMVLVELSLPQTDLIMEQYLIMAVIIISAGVILTITAASQLADAETTIHPFHFEEVNTLVEYGAYRYSRNPMYLGLTFILVGVSMVIGNPLNLLIVIAYIGTMTLFQIIPEERLLKKRFANLYPIYCKRVGRWI